MNPRVFRIRTPEGVVFSQVLAGPVIRFAAWLIDAVLVIMAVNVLSLGLLLLHLISADFAAALQIVSYFAISIGYGMVAEGLWRGQTLGKKLLRLRVMDAEGLKLTAHQVVIRNLLRFVDALPAAYAVGGLFCAWSGRFQRLGDLAAGTVVVRIARIEEPEFEKLDPPLYNSLRQFPHLAARLRQRVETTDAALAVNALLRREDFLPAERMTLYAELADFFRSRVAFPPEVLETLSAEQFVRNVVDVLYRAREKAAPNESKTPEHV